MVGFSYNGKRVTISPSADIPRAFWPDGGFADRVQRVIDDIEPWDPGELPIQTREGFAGMRPMVVANGARTPFWAVHRGHKAHPKNLDVSPFLKVREAPRATQITVELVGTPQKPRLVRAYPGDYVPPLPWQGSASQADGGREACLHFWRRHSYLYLPNLIREGTRTNRRPRWY